MFRAAMRDWTTATNGVVTFVEDAGGKEITFVYGGGGATNYDDCTGGVCLTFASQANVYHEIGHSLGLPHTWWRNDRNHYFAVRPMLDGGTGQCGGEALRLSTSDLDLGPFDYKSTMMYAGSYPAHTRFDGSPVCATNLCSDEQGCTRAPPPACADGGTGCWSCGLLPQSACTIDQPQGLPTRHDGAAAVEFYRAGIEPAWKKFRRTVNEVTSGVGATSPYDYSLAPGVTLSNPLDGGDPTPAVVSWGNSVVSVHVLGSDKHIYGKANNVGGNKYSWSAWTDLGCCLNSAPSAVSWAPNRTDVVARGEDLNIYIKTYSSGTWTSWQSLGAPSGGAGSAPAITSWGPNRLDVFVKEMAPGQRLFVRSCTANCNGSTGTWTVSWEAKFPNGGLLGKPAVVAQYFGGIGIYVHGGDHRLYGNGYFSNGTSYGWYMVNSETLGWRPGVSADLYAPAATVRGAQVDIFARGVRTNDDMLSVISHTGSWGSFKLLGGNLSSAPGTVSNPQDAGREDIMAVMDEERSFDGGIARGIWWKEYQP